MSATAVAGTLAVDSRTIPGLDPATPIVLHTLRLTGEIEAGDAERLRDALSRLRARAPPTDDGRLATIELSSIGGNLLVGIAIGYLLHDYGVATVVRKGDSCLSACALAFLGGTARDAAGIRPSRTIEIGGQVAFHNFTIDAAAVEKETRQDAEAGIARSFGLARAGAAQLMRYATDMGVAGTFVATLVGRPAGQWQYIDTDEAFIAAQACPAGPMPSPGRLEQQAANICNHATGRRTPARASDARSIALSQARRHLLEHIHENLVSFTVSGPLARQLAAVIASKDERLVEKVYADLRVAGVPLPRPSGLNFEVLGPGSDSRSHCFVSLSPGDLDVFDLALVTRHGLTRAPQQPPASCPMLFRYEPGDMLNPPR
ncbi:hypothetical protein [Reyranella sp.]|uniref:hypothetical protein n=1 Tax=Reyranella sp. TaxID=1929291 RepID=UPI003BACD456